MGSVGTISLSDGSIKDKHLAADAGIDPAKEKLVSAALFAISPTQWRTWDALQTNLPGTAASDDLAIATGTWGTDAPFISAGDVKNTSSTRRAACVVPMPAKYAAAQAVKLKAFAGMNTTVASSSCTVDFEAWRIDEDGTLGAADLVSTLAQSINSLTKDDFDFTLSAATLLPGDLLYIRMTVTWVDSATGTAVTPAVYNVQLLADTRG